MIRFWLWGLLVLWPGAVLRAEDRLELKSKQAELTLVEGAGRRLVRLLPVEELFIFRVTGPEDVGIRFRAMLGAGAARPVVDLTVVRDGSEQGTVRFSFPPADGAYLADRQDAGVSGEVLVKIEVPSGTHEYSVLVIGPRRGCLIYPFLGLRKQTGVVVATPGKTPVPAELPRQPEKASAPRKSRRGPLAMPETEILGDVA